MGRWRNLVRPYFSNINLLHPMQDSIKHHNTFTTIAAAKVEVIAIATVGVMNGSSNQTQVYRGVDK